ncbi:thiamine-phosphate synthase [Litorimonas cladophorae]|uniref:Thiamine-phosphate synthase n=1 Tax=Litorimonas cladophorae TaxID=1220491 RepID=A0A918KJ97_9PROT|nr:thiamine phosphate synthase [Litorimonas cladophorae]GGX64688.1 thiamine-phosphate synthase [Litorimonas cladophorae]
MIETCQIYLLTPPAIEDVPAFCEILKTTLAAAPVACLQIRLKDIEDSALVQAGTAITAVCHAAGVEVILNDRPDLVEQTGADGAHIGQEDMDYYSSREVLGGDAILGVTCHNSKELAFAAAKAGADYVAFGAFFETPTKDPKARAELEILTWWHEAVEIPSVAIGGITVDNAKAVIAAGADFIAVCSGVWSHPDGPAAAVSRLSALCSEHSPQPFL